VLAEGDHGLFEKAAGLVSACEARLDLARAAGPLPEEPAGDVTGGGRARAGRHGIRLFMEAFAARDILAPLPSFDDATVERLPPDAWPWPDLTLAGVRREGRTAGYLLREDFTDGGAFRVRDIDRRQRVALDAPLTEVIHVLTQFSRCFVELDGAVVGVVGRGDIGKPVARMWLFGIIILVEMQVVELVRARWPDGGWTAVVSAGRMEKARQLQAERQRRGLSADLLDCLQFSDKLQVAIQDPEFLETLGFGSAGAAKKVVKDLESLRNNLAHGQDVASHDWPQIARLARRVQQLYGT
jgi:hypothetical protein